MIYRIAGGDPFEIEDLATGKYGREDLVLFRGGQDENGIRRRLFQGLQKGIEGRGTEHMYLIDDIDLTLAFLRGKTHLLHQRPDIVHRIVAGGIELMDIQGT